MVARILISILFSGLALAQPETRASRLEELMLWKMSDELRLSPADEKAFGDIVRDLNRRKTSLTERLAADLDALKSAKDKERAPALTRYRKTLREAQDLPLEELDRMKKLLGEEKLVKYLDVKKDLADKVKALLLEKTESAPLPPPKLIEDKPEAKK